MHDFLNQCFITMIIFTTHNYLVVCPFQYFGIMKYPQPRSFIYGRYPYFLEHPEYLTDGVILSQFFISNPEAVVGKLCPQVSCFDSILMPLDLLNLVKGHRCRKIIYNVYCFQYLIASFRIVASGFHQIMFPNLAWLGLDGSEDLQLDKAALLPPPYLEATMLDPVVRPTNNPATTRTPLKICSCNPKICTKSR